MMKSVSSVSRYLHPLQYDTEMHAGHSVVTVSAFGAVTCVPNMQSTVSLVIVNMKE